MIVYKSPAEIELMRRAGRITADTIERLMEAVAPGHDHRHSSTPWPRGPSAGQGATPSFKGYRGFPASICTSLNEEVVHGIPAPSGRSAEGDILKLDVGAIWEGYHGDSAVSVFVGSPPSDVAEKLVRVTDDSLAAGHLLLRPGGRLSDVGHAVQQVAEGAGF